MKYNPNVAKTWLKSLDSGLPGLNQAIQLFSSDVLVLGACVFELYAKQDWVPPLKRKTGDLDLSLGVSSDSNKYGEVITYLKGIGYAQDPVHPYRFHPAQRQPGALAYVDLLAHSTVKGEESLAREVMGVQAGFSLEGMGFAQRLSFQIQSHVRFPNPIAFACLKRVAYQDDPNKRRKDLADIIELGSGLVRNGIHFELEDVWNQVKEEPEALKVKAMYQELAEGESARWDIWEVESDLKSRGFLEQDLEETLPAELNDLVNIGMS